MTKREILVGRFKPSGFYLGFDCTYFSEKKNNFLKGARWSFSGNY